MDPIAALENLKRNAHGVTSAEGDLTPEQYKHAATSLSEDFLALDTWLRHGGFLPAEWDNDRNKGREG